MMNNISEGKSGDRSRTTSLLNPELEKALSSYASAALAASVGLMAIAKSAEAKIVYTPADVPIPVNGGPVILDLNHDGITDFVFSNVFRSPSGDGYPSFASLLVRGKTRNQVWGRGVGTSHGSARFVSALPASFAVKANKSRLQESPTGLMARLIVDYGPAARQASSCSSWSPGCASSTSGQWMYTQHRYLGLQFEIKGAIHYGWARVVVSRTARSRGKNSIKATLRGYAYETVANRPIITGKTHGPNVVTMPADAARDSLGALAVGRK